MSLKQHIAVLCLLFLIPSIAAQRKDSQEQGDNDQRKCGQALTAFKETCGRKGDRCDVCVEEGRSKLEVACGEKADHVAQLVCKRRGQDQSQQIKHQNTEVRDHSESGIESDVPSNALLGDLQSTATAAEPQAQLERHEQTKDQIASEQGGGRRLNRKCGQALRAFKETCGRKGDGCYACVEEGKSKLEVACGEKADHVAHLVCKRRGQDQSQQLKHQSTEDRDHSKSGIESDVPSNALLGDLQSTATAAEPQAQLQRHEQEAKNQVASEQGGGRRLNDFVHV